ncbi:hypothetical protein ZWY2020_056160 [Hordeum vulgare]|nr:hypothetical protein ZWY2020_056160 [Hordeum vulgare]
MEIANRYTNGEEENFRRSSIGRASDAPQSGNARKKKKRKGEPAGKAEVAAVPGQGQGKYKKKKDWAGQKKAESKSTLLDQPCPINSRKDEEGETILSKHTTRDCHLPQKEMDRETSEDKQDEDDPAGTSGYPSIEATIMIFADVERKRRLKVIHREVNMAASAVTKYLDWAKTRVTFDQSDHPASIATPGRHALVVDPAVNGFRLRKVLMDGGSGLNIIYVDTLKAMDTPLSRLSKSNMQFHGVIPRKKAESLGEISLSVVFDNVKIFRKERLTFEVVDFRSSYHTILGRPAYTCFMAHPCYVYLKLKMPGPKGVITLTGDRKVIEECLQQGSKISNEPVLAAELDGYKKAVDIANLLNSKRPATESAFQSAGEMKQVQIHPTDSSASKTNISTSLGDK